MRKLRFMIDLTTEGKEERERVSDVEDNKIHSSRHTSLLPSHHSEWFNLQLI